MMLEVLVSWFILSILLIIVSHYAGKWARNKKS